MNQIDDEILKDLLKDIFKDFQIGEPSIKSQICGHKLKRMCTCHQCQEFSLYCLDDTCEKSYQKHTFCHKSITLKAITDLLNQHMSSNKKFLEKMMKIEETIINNLTKNKEDVVRKMSLGNLEQRYERVIEQIYRNGDGQTLKGKEADAFFQKLLFLSKVKINPDIYLQKFERAASKAFNELIASKEAVINQYLFEIKAVNYTKAQDFNSTVLKKDVINYQESLSFILQSLQKPKRLELLFRASEHQFQAAKFHQKCDDIPQTFTIIRTEFGKTIAGYNHLRWISSEGADLIDNEKRCFLLSIDLKQKMVLTNNKKAIFCRQDYGPTFGGSNDIMISNKCNQNNFSCANFPSCYNLTDRAYSNNQETWTTFSGATNGKNFKVIDYEVYRVIR